MKPPHTVVAAMLTSMIATACGGQATGPGGGDGSSGGSGSSSGGVGSGCEYGMTTTSTVDPTLCQAQLQSTSSCNGSVCSWDVEVPCTGDAGAADAGSNGAPACEAWCAAAAPPGVMSQVPFCQTVTIDGGTAVVARCGGCGI